MARKQLDDKLDCKQCGMIQLDIPEDVADDTPIHCSNCGSYMGTWGELVDDFAKQTHPGETFDLNKGKITEIK